LTLRVNQSLAKTTAIVDCRSARPSRLIQIDAPFSSRLSRDTRRLVDRRVLHLIKMWLECAVEETDDRGRKTRTTAARDNRRGIPQGSPISPLLANLYMRRFVLGWKMLGLEQSLGSRNR
jgi:RNA-directed DNA polymerase